MFASWYRLAMLAAESQRVIGLRMLKLSSGGPAAEAEAKLMVTEKMAAATNAAQRLMLGATPDSVVEGYRRTVRANARRLSRR